MKLVFLGPPGAGKGTQAENICRHCGIAHISTGDMLRGEIKAGTELGRRAGEIMEAGGLVSDDIITGMVEKRIKEPDCERGFLLDGFPRTVAQADALAQFADIDMAVNISVPAPVLVERMSGRRVCSGCGACYSVSSCSGDVCEKCGAKLYVRSDDKPETVLNRINVYNDKTRPLISYYAGKSLLRNVDGNKAPEEVYKDIKALVDGI